MSRERKIQIVLDDDNIEKQILTDLKVIHQDKNSETFKVQEELIKQKHEFK